MSHSQASQKSKPPFVWMWKRLPAIVGIGFTLLTLVLWQHLRSQNQYQVRRAIQRELEGVELTTIHLKHELVAAIDEQILHLSYLSQLIANAERLGEPTQDIWQREAEKLHKHLGGYHLLAWVKPAGQIQRVLPRFASQSAQHINLILAQSHPTADELARSSNQRLVTSTVRLSPNRQGFLVYMPILKGAQLDGFIVAAFAFDELFQGAQQPGLPRLTENYSIAILDAHQIVYQQGEVPSNQQWAREKTIDIQDKVWQLKVWPKPGLIPESISKEKSHYPEWVLGIGLGFAILLARMTYLAQTVQQRANQIERVNQSLSAENLERQQAELFLKAAEEKYRSIFENATEGIFQTTFEGRYLNANPALAQIYGYPSPKALICHLTNIEHQLYVDPTRRAEFLRKLEEDGTVVQFESQVYRQDGRMIWISENAHVVHNVNGEFLYYEGTVADITQRKHAEEQLQLIQFTLEQIGDAVFFMGSDARFFFVNAMACQTLGYLREELLGMTALDITPGFYPDAWTRHWQKLRQAKSFTFETAHQTKAGEVFPVEVTVNYLEFNGKEYNCAIARNISERKRIEAELQGQALQQASVAELGQRALAGLDLTRLFQEAVLLVSKVLNVQYALVWEHLSEQDTVGIKAGVGLQRSVMDRVKVGTGTQSQAGYTLLVGEPVVVEDLRLETRFKSAAILRENGVIAGVSVIIPGPTQPFGVLSAYSRQQQPFSRDHVHFLRAIANVLATAISRHQTQENLRLMERAIASSHNGIVIADATQPDNPVIYANPSFESITGYSATEVIGQNCRFLQGDDSDQSTLDQIRVAIAQGRECSVILKNYRRDGTMFWNQLSIAPVLNDEGQLTHFIGIQNDITERKQIQEQLEHNALHDALTGLPNRVLFMDRLDHAIQIAKRRHNYQFAVLFFDLDHFKVINDSLGHHMGDQVLIAIARKLELHLRPTDTIARLGGDEFTILLEDLSEPQEASRIAERIQAELQAPIDLSGREVVIGTSIGIATNELGYKRAADLLRDADIAMYQAKAAGRSRHQVFDKIMHAKTLQRLELETALRQALDSTDLQVYYQPIVSLASGQLVGFEALARWFHPQKGLIPPDEFIPIAEETGLISLLGQRMIKEVCHQLQQWRQQAPFQSDLTININLSGKQLPDPNFTDYLDQILKTTNLEGSSLKFEITESVLIQNAVENSEVLQALQARNIGLCIDDFGTGYSSLSYLHRFPVNTLKIDRSFIGLMGQCGEKYEIVRAIIGLAHNLGMTVVAEGIETVQQLDVLHTLGCEQGQGYLFSRPVPASEAIEWIQRKVKIENKVEIPSPNLLY